VASNEVVVGRQSWFRWRWFATRLHVFVVVFAVPDLSADRAEELTAAAQDYAVTHKGGLPRGIQTGTATVAVFVTEQADPGVRDWFEQAPKHRFAALRFPVLVELSDGKLAYFRGRMRIGRVYLSHLRGVAEEVIGPAVR
jgi:hypothetical protein